jgi:hypothetical protein
MLPHTFAYGAGQFAPATAGNWDIARTSPGGGLKQHIATNVTSAELLYCDIGSPTSGGSSPIVRRLTSVVAEVQGITSGTLPAVMPTFKIYAPDGTLLETVTDSSSSNAEFTAQHTIGITVSPSIQATPGCFLARLSAPSGGGTSAGFRVFSIQAFFDIDLPD